MKHRSVMFLALFLLVVLCEGSFAATLVNDGKPAAEIVLGKKASSTEKYAAEELQLYIQKISGATLPIVEEGSTAITTQRILLGTPETNIEIAGLKNKLRIGSALGRDGFVINASESSLILAGHKPAGALYATYAFLEEHLGVRWYWPGEDGEFVPKELTIIAENINVSQVPDFTFRAFRCYVEKDQRIWAARNRINSVSHGLSLRNKSGADIKESRDMKMGMRAIHGAHSFGMMYPREMKNDEGMHGWPGLVKYKAKYPEHFAFKGGKRIQGQHCYSNPAVQKVFIEWIIDFWNEQPDAEILCLGPMDTNAWCQCENCKAFGKDVSTQLHKFLNIVLKKVEKVHPGKKYRCFLYSTYKKLPSVKPYKGLILDYCLYERCYRHTLSDKNCKFSARSRKNLKAWMALGHPMHMYGYQYYAIKGGYFLPNAFLMAEELRYLKKIGFTGFGPEQTQKDHNQKLWSPGDPWKYNRFSMYLCAKLMWNTKLEEAKLLNEWMQKLYLPKAALHMVKYYKVMEKAWGAAGDPQKDTGHLTNYFNNPDPIVDDFLNPAVIKRASNCLSEAKKAIQSIEDKEIKGMAEKRFQLDQKIFDDWVELYRTKKRPTP